MCMVYRNADIYSFVVIVVLDLVTCALIFSNHRGRNQLKGIEILILINSNAKRLHFNKVVWLGLRVLKLNSLKST